MSAMFVKMAKYPGTDPEFLGYSVAASLGPDGIKPTEAQKARRPLSKPTVGLARRRRNLQLQSVRSPECLRTSANSTSKPFKKTKKPKESLGFVSICRLLADAGFTLKIGDIGFEPTTSTMSTLRSNQLS